MATYTSTRKTLIIPGSSSKTFHYNDGEGDIYINSSILRRNQGENQGKNQGENQGDDESKSERDNP